MRMWKDNRAHACHILLLSLISYWILFDFSFFLILTSAPGGAYSKAPHSSSIGMRQVGSQARSRYVQLTSSNASDEMSNFMFYDNILLQSFTIYYTLLLYYCTVYTVIYYELIQLIWKDRDTERERERQREIIYVDTNCTEGGRSWNGSCSSENALQIKIEQTKQSTGDFNRWSIAKCNQTLDSCNQGLTWTHSKTDSWHDSLACPRHRHEAANFVPIAQVEAITNVTRSPYSQMMPDAYRKSAEDSKGLSKVASCSVMFLQVNSDIFRHALTLCVLFDPSIWPVPFVEIWTNTKNLEECCIEMRQKFKAVTMERYRWRTDILLYYVIIYSFEGVRKAPKVAFRLLRSQSSFWCSQTELYLVVVLRVCVCVLNLKSGCLQMFVMFVRCTSMKYWRTMPS